MVLKELNAVDEEASFIVFDQRPDRGGETLSTGSG